jgi:RNA polymerase sigma-70 factor (ECF subfamily)
MTMAPTFDDLRPKLFAIAYRMLGSVMEAEDAVQEALLRAQRVEWAGVEHPPAFMRKMLIRICLDALKAARTGRETYYGEWLPEPLPTPDPAEQAEALSTALLLLMERLSPEERAVFVLRELYEYDYAEIADLLDKSPAACRKLLSRARARLHAPELPLRPLDPPEQHRETFFQFMMALQAGDPAGVMALLAPDVASFADGAGVVPAAVRPLYGPEMVSRLFLGLARQLSADHSTEVASFNGREAFVFRDPTGRVVDVVQAEVVGGKIQRLYSILAPGKLRHLNIAIESTS